MLQLAFSLLGRLHNYKLITLNWFVLHFTFITFHITFYKANFFFLFFLNFNFKIFAFQSILIIKLNKNIQIFFYFVYSVQTYNWYQIILKDIITLHFNGLRKNMRVENLRRPPEIILS